MPEHPGYRSSSSFAKSLWQEAPPGCSDDEPVAVPPLADVILQIDGVLVEGVVEHLELDVLLETLAVPVALHLERDVNVAPLEGLEKGFQSFYIGGRRVLEFTCAWDN